ncbi:hypothetical protein [Acidipila sp. EB88]|uniref:hypothetical protein n=1 Tax=Acidipila sp. EB88 TaxID=2305226 RepID=UPI001315A5C3|nr:hypothetical protein [Acidipila sp. EB88]
MKRVHTPQMDVRYWAAITLASVFGTNMGDLYAHKSGLGIGMGLVVLALLAAAVFLLERFDDHRREIYYWLVILLIRTGATNIADYSAYRLRVPGLPLTLGTAALIGLFGWMSSRRARGPEHTPGLPGTNAAYWLAMLSAGIFGTVLGDICEHAFGEGFAALALGAILLLALLAGYRRAAQWAVGYWSIIAVARTTGTAIGDWVAENKIIPIGLPLATLLSATAFVLVLLAWGRGDKGAGRLEADGNRA